MVQRWEKTQNAADIQGAVRGALEQLRKANVESPRLTAELLLGHILGWDRIRILNHPNAPLKSEQKEHFAALVRRRAAGEPLQYLTGVQEFFGLPFLVTPAVLIPRPETEILVEKALGLAHGLGGTCLRFVDVGTGSGCIAVAFANKKPDAMGWAVDLSGAALTVARQNALRHGVSDRLRFLQADLMDCFPPRPCFELILSNPPYVAEKEAESLPPMVRDHEPHVALFSGDSGMDVYGRLIPQAAQRLIPGGYFLVEVGVGMSEEVGHLVAREGLLVESIETDLQAIPRCVVARRCHG